MEGPGSIFRGFGRQKRYLKAFLGGEHFATNLSCIIGPFAGEKWPRSCRATGRLPRMPVLPCPGGDGRDAHGVGWPAVSPPWGLSIRRPPKVCRACWIQTTSLTTKAPDPTTDGQAPDDKLKFLDQGSYTPLFFSPQEPGDHRRPCAKKRKNGTLSLFFSIFCPSKLQSKFCIEKTSKKV